MTESAFHIAADVRGRRVRLLAWLRRAVIAVAALAQILSLRGVAA